RADLPADREQARHRPGVVLHAGGGVPADRVDVAAGRAFGVLPQGRGAAVGPEGHLPRHDAVHGAAGHRFAADPVVPVDRAMAARRAAAVAGKPPRTTRAKAAGAEPRPEAPRQAGSVAARALVLLAELARDPEGMSLHRLTMRLG